MPELQKLNENRAIFVRKLNVSVTFLADLQTKSVITDETKGIIQVDKFCLTFLSMVHFLREVT